MPLEISNYWDDFPQRVAETAQAVNNGKLPPLQRLALHLTDGCNLNCGYCNKHRGIRHDMNQQLTKFIIDQHSQAGGNTIHFTGGEPTLVPWFGDICHYAKERGLTVSANTNALKKVDVSHIDKLKASFDSLNSTAGDQLLGIPGSFDQIVKNLKIYSEEMDGRMLSLTTVLNRRSYRHMPELAEFVLQNFRVHNLYYSNYKGSNPDFAFTDDEITDMFQNYIPRTLAIFEQHGQDYSHRQLVLHTPQDFVNRARYGENNDVPCYLQLSELTIDMDGNCHNCSHLFRDGVAPVKRVSLQNSSLAEAFTTLKQNCFDGIPMAPECLTGCNRNLVNFNAAVGQLLK